MLSKLPAEMISFILQYLHENDIKQLLLVSKTMNQKLSLHQKLIRKIKNKSIYNDTRMMKQLSKPEFRTYMVKISTNDLLKLDSREIFWLMNRKVVMLTEFNQLIDLAVKLPIEKYLLSSLENSLLINFPNESIQSSFRYTERTIGKASQYGFEKIVGQLLHDARIDPSDFYNEAIRKACEHGHTNIVRMLLQDPRVDPSVWSNTALSLASANGHLEIVKILVNDKRVAHFAGYQIIKSAYQNGQWSIVCELLKLPQLNLTRRLQRDILEALPKNSASRVVYELRTILGN
jgi:hypothetical protein